MKKVPPTPREQILRTPLRRNQAARLAGQVAPRFAIPNHYDLMALNAENPKTFEFFLQQRHPGITPRILETLEPFVWA